MSTRWLGRWFGATSIGNDVPLRPRTGGAIDPAVSVWQLVDPDDALVAELARARRYERAFSIVAVSQNPLPEQRDGTSNGTNGTALQEMASLSRMSPQVAAAGLREALRENDVLCYQPDHGCFILGLTESDKEAARRAVKRVRTLFSSRLHVDLAVGVAQFPSDSLTLEDLIDTARAVAASAADVSRGSGATGATNGRSGAGD